MPPFILITPSNRGIGLSLARRLLRQTSLPIIATTRSSTPSLHEAILRAEPEPPSQRDADCVQPSHSSHAEAPHESESRLHMLGLDVANEDSIRAAAEECASRFPSKSKGEEAHWLHLAFCIPGILKPEKSPAQLEIEDIRAQFETNIIGPMLILKHFASFVPRKSTRIDLSEEQTGGIIPGTHATWANMSARVGSITDNNLGGWYSYRASKAGVNQVTKTFDNYLKTMSGDNATSVALHPGTVKTELSQDFWGNVKKDRLFSSDYAAERLLEVVKSKSMEGRGRCWDWSGEEIPP